MKTCVDCGASSPTQATFCGECGMPLRRPKLPPPANTSAPTTYPSPPMSAPPPQHKPSKADRVEMLGQAGASAMKAGCALFFAVPLLLIVFVVIGGLLFG